MDKNSKPLSQRQQQILTYIDKYTEKNGYTPTVREITEHLQLKSPSSIHYQLKVLEQAGYIKRSTNKDRSIRMNESAPGLPVFQSAQFDNAGNFVNSGDAPEYYLPFVFRDKTSFFALKCAKKEIASADIGDICIFRSLNRETDESYDADFGKYVSMGSYVLVTYNGQSYIRQFTIKKAHVWYVVDPNVGVPQNPNEEEIGDIDGLDAEVDAVLCFVVKDYMTR